MRLPKMLGISVLLLTLTARAVQADDVRDISTNEVYTTAEASLPPATQAGQPDGPYTVVAGGPISGVQLLVQHIAPDKPITIPLFGIDNPPLSAGPYRVEGLVSYSGTNGSTDLSGTAYLELWSTFADGRRYFSRTLADAGPMQKFSGHSIERHFGVSFDPAGQGIPTRLELNLVFNGTGQVTLEEGTGNGLLALVQDVPLAAAATPPPPPVMRTSPSQLTAALRLQPEMLIDMLHKQDYLLGQLALANSESGPSSDAVTAVRQKLQARQDEIDRIVESLLAAKAMQPRWLTWLDDHVAGWWWGVLFPIVILAQAWSVRSRFRAFVTATMLIIGELCFGWGMAALGSGEDVPHVAVPLVFGAMIVLVTLLRQPLLRWQQSAELRRIAVMDAA